MADSSRPNVTAGPETLRLSDADRSAALEPLGEHVAEGRLDIAEFEDRSAIVAAASGASDLVPAFEAGRNPAAPRTGTRPRKSNGSAPAGGSSRTSTGSA